MDTFKIPETWWFRWCRRSNGYFGCEDTTDEQGKFDGYSNSSLVSRLLLRLLKEIPRYMVPLYHQANLRESTGGSGRLHLVQIQCLHYAESEHESKYCARLQPAASYQGASS
jgi:hypothetical protein